MPLARHDKSMERSGGYIQFLLTCLLRGMTPATPFDKDKAAVSTHMPLARHDALRFFLKLLVMMFLLTCLLRGMTGTDGKKPSSTRVSTHMPLARHDV